MILLLNRIFSMRGEIKLIYNVKLQKRSDPKSSGRSTKKSKVGDIQAEATTGGGGANAL